VLGLLIALLLAGCGEQSDPLQHERLVFVRGTALAAMLARAERLEETPLARHARRLASLTRECDDVWARLPADSSATEPKSPIDLVPGCLRDATGIDPALLERVADRRGAHSGLVLWPLGDGGRLELRIDVDDRDDLVLTGQIEAPATQGLLSLFMPGREPPAPSVLSGAESLLHLRMRPRGGLDLAALLPADGQADRLFALKGRLLGAALLAGTWELALLPPAADGRVPLLVGALHHRNDVATREALDEALDQLESTWPIRRTPHRFALAEAAGEEVEGACFLDLPLLPELAPCWAVTPRAFVIGYRGEGVAAALSGPGQNPVAGAEATLPAADEPERSGLLVEFDRVSEVDRRLPSGEAGRTRMSDLWSKLEVRLEAEEAHRVRLDARLEARS